MNQQRKTLWALLAVLIWAGAMTLPASAAGASDVMTALKTMSQQTGTLRTMMSNLSTAQFTFVDVSAQQSDPAFQAALKKDASQIKDLQLLLNGATPTDDNGVITPMPKILKAKNILIGQVVAVMVSPDQQITVFYD